MRRELIAIIAMLTAGLPQAQAAADPAAEVKAAFENYDQGWRTFDAKRITNAFADDFEWTNEVGLRFADKAKLSRFLGAIFRDPAFRAGKPGPLLIRSIKLLAPDIAVVESTEATDGQVDTATGKTVKVLHTNELSVLQKQAGRWVIVSDLTSDESHGI